MISSSRRRTDTAADGRDDALAPCARSVAGDPDLQLDQLTLATDAEPSAAPLEARGRSDRTALLRKHHDVDVHRRLSPANRAAAAFFDALEAERVEALGARRLAGVGRNLDRLRARERAGGHDAVDGVADAARRAWRGAAMPHDDDEALPDGVAERLAAALPRLERQLADQHAFARTARALAMALARDVSGGGPGQTAADGSGEAGAPGGADAEQPIADEDVDALAEDVESTPSDGADDEPAPLAADAEAEGEPASEIGDDARDEPPAGARDPLAAAAAAQAPGYRVWTTRFDEVRRPSELADAQALAGWRDDLDRHIALQGRLVRKLAARLERVLLARQRREWQFDQDEGELDARRLTRLVTAPLTPLAFKQETETRFRDTTVTLLIDNSRSMLGRPITIAAAAADILSRTLERCGVSVEVLGFTTVSLHGGRASEAWQAAGSPASPGRLNELRHIVYKGADVPYRSARRGLGLMLSREILKQNIDGESLAWAHARLLRRPEQRRVLMVISDGAPVDTSTLSANRRDLLSRHLHQVIAGIERARSVELCAIGIGHDVGRYYRRAMTVHDARELGPAMLGELDTLLREAA